MINFLLIELSTIELKMRRFLNNFSLQKSAVICISFIQNFMLKVDSLHKYQVELINNNRYLNILKRHTRISGAYSSDIFLKEKRSLLQIYICTEISVLSATALLWIISMWENGLVYSEDKTIEILVYFWHGIIILIKALKIINYSGIK